MLPWEDALGRGGGDQAAGAGAVRRGRRRLRAQRGACGRRRPRAAGRDRGSRAGRAGGRAIVLDSLSPDERELDRLLDDVERWRDPSHVRSYTRGEWLGFFEAAGLRVEETAVFRKAHELQDWVARSRATPENVARV